jgi:hypothetical protein
MTTRFNFASERPRNERTTLPQHVNEVSSQSVDTRQKPMSPNLEHNPATIQQKRRAVEYPAPSAPFCLASKPRQKAMYMNGRCSMSRVPLLKQEGLAFMQPPNPSIEGTLSGLRPPSAPHVKR